jgi:peptidoglycan/LPS O-acetylase OafA/YrhL
VISLRPPMLDALAHGRANNCQLLRIAAASAVIFFHCFALTNHWTDEPLWRMLGDWNFGALGVQIFFVISGFLVTMSWQRRAHLPPFAAARALRIYPALVMATIFTVIMAGLSSPIAWTAFLADPQTIDFAWRAASGWDLRYELPGAFAANPFPRGVNGSLYTLPIELRLYVGVALAGVLGLVTRRWLFAAAIVGAIGATILWPQWFPFTPNDDTVRRAALLFALGALAWVFRDCIPVSLPLGLLAVAAVLVNPAGVGRGALFGPLFTYAILVVAYHPRLQWPAFNRVGDYSYGIYVYSFPIQQTLVERASGLLAPWALFAATMPLVLAMAALSWHGLEKPALGLKSRFRNAPVSRFA